MSYDPRAYGALCDQCPLNYQKPVPPTGWLKADVVVVGESPGYQEVRRGQPFVGPSGDLLNELLEGVSLDRGHVWITNTILCLKGETLVMLPGRKTAKVRDLVENQYRGNVLSMLPTGEIVERAVIGWHRSARAGRKFLKVSSRFAKGNGRGQVGPIVTEDHTIWTRRAPGRAPQWVAAGELESTDQIATGHLQLFDAGRSIVIGSILGDGHITEKSPALQISHWIFSSDYMELKRLALRDLHPTVAQRPPTVNQKADQLYLRTESNMWLRSLRDDFYRVDGSARVPTTNFLDEMSLAIWFMDNGYMRHRSGRQALAEIASNRYSKSDVEILCGQIARLGIEAKPRFGSGWRIAFDGENSKKLSRKIAPYVPASMQYKLIEADRGRFNVSLYDPSSATTFWDSPEVTEVHHRAKTVFCIDVEETHNFLTVNAVVHNCRPEVPDLLGPKRYDLPTFLAYIRSANAKAKKLAKQTGQPAKLITDPISCCQVRLYSELKYFEQGARARGRLNGAVVIPVGNYAAQTVTGIQSGIMKLRGSPIPITMFDPPKPAEQK